VERPTSVVAPYKRGPDGQWRPYLLLTLTGVKPTADGLSGEVEIISRMRGPAFECARSAEGFAEVFVDAEIGTVAWSGGADLAPDTLYERVRSGAWPVDIVAAESAQMSLRLRRFTSCYEA